MLNKNDGYFGEYGGRYVPEMLIPALEELEKAFYAASSDPYFAEELHTLFSAYNNRPTPLSFAKNLTDELKGARIFLKLENLNHTGAHKINNALGQALLARRLGKRTLIAETGAGQHGVAVATAAAKLGLKAKIFMGQQDMERQYPNVFLMKTLGADVVSVPIGQATLKEAVNAALKDWIQTLDDAHYLIGSAVGPHPYPAIVKYFQSVIGREAIKQLQKHRISYPDFAVACVGGGSNAIGLFSAFISDHRIRLIGVEAGGKGSKPGDHARRFSSNGSPGIAQGYHSLFLQSEEGQLLPTHSISAGLDYAGVSPEIAYLYKNKRVEMTSATDQEALSAYNTLARLEGIIPALESAHALAWVIKNAPKMNSDKVLLVNISGRGDKDIFITACYSDPMQWKAFLKRQWKGHHE
ncbi:MAG TPA: tryptophan synthase subunit beta [Firmicutes bacterium]|nr:tryptophan synthase subunit beta [Bacillota bacterium]